MYYVIKTEETIKFVMKAYLKQTRLILFCRFQPEISRAFTLNLLEGFFMQDKKSLYEFGEGMRKTRGGKGMKIEERR